MSLRITFVRHGRSKANEAGIWQGQGNAPLSDEGISQIKLLAERLSGRSFDLVISSDLDRAHDTAAALGVGVEDDPAWREMDLGGWEGRTFEEVIAHHSDLLTAIRGGEAVAFGGTGETIAEFEHRVFGALDAVIDRVGDGEVLIATHGGVIDTVVGRFLGKDPSRFLYPIVSNTSLTTLESGGLRLDQSTIRLASFNDAGHLGHTVGYLAKLRNDGVPVLGFVRHGVTTANKEGRIQGSSCWGLHPDGHVQAARFSQWYGPVDHLVSSPLLRARQTASAIAEEFEIDDDVAEMSFGDWEGRVFGDLVESGDEQMLSVYRDGVDLPRGGSGETFAQVIERMRGFIDRARPRGRTVVVSHGAAIRALVGAVVGADVEMPDTLGVPANTGVSHVAITDQGPVLVDYSLAPHLERM